MRKELVGEKLKQCTKRTMVTRTIHSIHYYFLNIIQYKSVRSQHSTVSIKQLRSVGQHAPWSSIISISGFFSSSSPPWNLLPSRDVSRKRPNSVKPASWGLTSNHFPKGTWDCILHLTQICTPVTLLWVPKVMNVSTFYRPMRKTVLLYSTVDGVRVWGISVGLIWKTACVHLMRHKIFNGPHPITMTKPVTLLHQTGA